jgi:hypothetical protein
MFIKVITGLILSKRKISKNIDSPPPLSIQQLVSEPGSFSNNLTAGRKILQEKWPVKIFLLQPDLLYSMEQILPSGKSE